MTKEKINRRISISGIERGRVEMRRMQAAKTGRTEAMRMDFGRAARATADRMGEGPRGDRGMPEIADHAAEHRMGGEVFDLAIFGRRWICRLAGAGRGRIFNSGKRVARRWRT